MPDLQSPRPLAESDGAQAFDCGQPALDEFLRRHALDKQRAMLSRTYVVTDGLRVVGYYTLAHVSIVREDAPKKLGRGMPDAIPAMLMARFAVDRAYQGRGLGRSLFTDSIRRTWAAMAVGAAPMRFFVVDAKNEDARRFYERWDMVPSPHDPMRLFLSYKTLQTLFEVL